MIDPEDRFWINGASDNHVTRETYVVDWDQRRTYTIIGPSRDLDEDEDLETRLLERHISKIDHDVCVLTVDGKGSLVSTSSSLEDDTSLTPYFPDFLDCPSLHDIPTVFFSELTESDRLGPMVDLVTYIDAQSIEKKVVFKYSSIFQRISFTWKELHLLKSLPSHPNLLPIDRVVLDDKSNQVLGLTVPYISGSSLDDMKDRTFALRHLEQLTGVVDLLNLQLGIEHQDIAPRNLLMQGDNIILFDFDRAAVIGDEREHWPERNDVKGVAFTLYEIITSDDSFRGVDFPEQKEEAVLGMETWPQKCRLDGEVVEFRRYLDAWIRRRRKNDGHTPAQVRQLKIPEIPEPRPIVVGVDEKGEPIYEAWAVQTRKKAVKYHNHIVDWRRPPQRHVGRANKCTVVEERAHETCTDERKNSRQGVH